ncbi:MAG TPA: hypothetical protein VFV13_07050 [Acidimicrobiia bacterium]|nr:hypothetical protein [Acidimicrobiia bacterium]
MSDDLLPDTDGQDGKTEVPTPFSFKLMIVLTVIYLGWRLIEGIVWLVQRLT